MNNIMVVGMIAVLMGGCAARVDGESGQPPAPTPAGTPAAAVPAAGVCMVAGQPYPACDGAAHNYAEQYLDAHGSVVTCLDSTSTQYVEPACAVGTACSVTVLNDGKAENLPGQCLQTAAQTCATSDYQCGWNAPLQSDPRISECINALTTCGPSPCTSSIDATGAVTLTGSDGSFVAQCAPPSAPTDAQVVDSVTCVQQMSGGAKTVGDFYCGSGGIYTVTLGNGETCDATHKPHACPSGTPCTVSGGTLNVVGVCP